MSANVVSIISVFIALMSLTATQFRPIYTHFDRPDLKIYVPPVLKIFQLFGQPQAFLDMSIANTGNAEGQVSDIRTEFCEAKACSHKLAFDPAQRVMTSDQPIPLSAKPTVPLGQFLVDPHQSWNGTLAFSIYVDRNTQNQIAELSVKLRDALSPKFDLSAEPPKSQAEAQERGRAADEQRSRTFADYEKFANDQLATRNLGVGEYRLLITACLAGSLVTNTYNFNLFEPEIAHLKRSSSIFEDPGRTPFNIAAPPEVPVSLSNSQTARKPGCDVSQL